MQQGGKGRILLRSALPTCPGWNAAHPPPAGAPPFRHDLRRCWQPMSKSLAPSNKSQDAAKATYRCEVRLQQGSVAMLDRHITCRMILAPIAGIGAILLSSVPGFAVDGPSFDCTRGVNSALAIILCSAPEAAQADWDLASAYWAFSTDDRDQTAFGQSMNQRCALPRQETAEERVGRAFAQEVGQRIWSYTPPVPGPQPITQNHVRCVVAAFHNRAAILRSKLKGDALAESKLSPEEHMQIQAALIEKGFLRNRFRDYGANADGQFGPNTRAAIKDFQRSIGARETGFLSYDQRMALIESPQERQARVQSEAVERQARLEREAAERQARLVLLRQKVATNDEENHLFGKIHTSAMGGWNGSAKIE